MRTPLACLATVGLAASLAVGCGSSAQSTGLSSSSAGRLQSQLAAVASDAARGDRAGALDALSAVGDAVRRDAPKLTSSQKAALSTGIARVRSRIMATVPAPATTTATTATTPAAPTTTTAQPPAPPPPHPPHDHGPPGHDKGHGHGGGHGGDGGNGGGNGGGD
jgi:hypothetical protein